MAWHDFAKRTQTVSPWHSASLSCCQNDNKMPASATASPWDRLASWWAKQCCQLLQASDPPEACAEFMAWHKKGLILQVLLRHCRESRTVQPGYVGWRKRYLMPCWHGWRHSKDTYPKEKNDGREDFERTFFAARFVFQKQTKHWAHNSTFKTTKQIFFHCFQYEF